VSNRHLERNEPENAKVRFSQALDVSPQKTFLSGVKTMRYSKDQQIRFAVQCPNIPREFGNSRDDILQ